MLGFAKSGLMPTAGRRQWDSDNHSIVTKYSSKSQCNSRERLTAELDTVDALDTVEVVVKKGVGICVNN